MIDVEIFPKFFDDLVRLLMTAPKSVLIKHWIRLQSKGCSLKSVLIKHWIRLQSKGCSPKYMCE